MAAAHPTTSRYALGSERHLARPLATPAQHPLRFAETDASLIDGVWWAFVSTSRVGNGDLAPKSPGTRMLATFDLDDDFDDLPGRTAALAVAEWRGCDDPHPADDPEIQEHP